MQTILGAGGAIGRVLAKSLHPYTDRVRLVSRNPKRISPNDELISADLTNAAATAEAVKGSEVAYLLAGLPYKLKVWQAQWPLVMQNVIAACKQHGTKLVFFDNIYMYDAARLGNITEETPLKPPSKKGQVRHTIAQQLLTEVKSGNLQALIARSADFYGPDATTSVLYETVYKNLKKGKKAQWLADASKVHSFTYVPDAAQATALLGNTPTAYNQVWHLPTSSQRLAGRDWIALFATYLHTAPRYTTLSKGMLKMLGLFVPVLGEIHEMLYQYDRDYFFNSQKFQQQFPDFLITSYEEGVKQTVAAGEPD